MSQWRDLWNHWNLKFWGVWGSTHLRWIFTLYYLGEGQEAGEGKKQNEESFLRICFQNQVPLHNLLLQWQNTRKFAVLHSSQYNKWINWRQALKELFANGHHARVTHAMLPAEFLSWVQKIQIDAPPKRVYINLHFIH